MEDKTVKLRSYKVEIYIDGLNCGAGSVTIGEDGAFDTSDAEEEFHKTLRKKELTLKKNAESEWREEIIEALSPADEETLRTEHAKDYHGTDDDMVEAYESWLEDLDLSDLKRILKHG